MQKKLFTLVLFMALAMMVLPSVIAQESSPTATPSPDSAPEIEATFLPGLVDTGVTIVQDFPYTPEVQVESVQFTDSRTLIVSGYQTDGCEYPLTPHLNDDRDQQALFIEIERELMTFAPVECTGEPLAFEVQVTLDAVLNADALSGSGVGLIVHNFAGLITANDGAVPQVTPQTSIPYIVKDFTISASDSVPAQFEIRINGFQTNGCDVPSLHYIKVTENQRITVHTFRLQPDNLICTEIAPEYQETLSLGEISGVYMVSVNGITKFYDFDRMEPLANTFESETVIENVDAIIAESFPPLLSLHITGYQSDGCQFPVVEELRTEGNNISVKIYRLMPVSAMCPAMIVPYEKTFVAGSFAPGHYTIDVNGTVIEVEL